MHLQTIVHSVAFFGIENAAAPVSGQPREIHSKARFGLQDESVQGIARGSLPLKASAAQAVAAFFTRVFYHTPGRLSSIFMREFEILCLGAASRLSLWESWREAPERASPARQSRHTAIGRLFVRAILSLCLCFSVSILALSVTFGDTARVAAPSVCFAIACILLAAAPTAPPCFRHWRRSSLLLPKGEALRPAFLFIPLSAPPAPARISLYKSPAGGRSAYQWPLRRAPAERGRRGRSRQGLCGGPSCSPEARGGRGR